MTAPALAVRHETDSHRFVAEIDGEATEAMLRYRPIDARTLDYYSTFTPPALRGQGIAGQIVTAALDHALTEGLRVVPTCPYVAKLIERNPKYAVLVA